jgi:hypothetical protein
LADSPVLLNVVGAGGKVSRGGNSIFGGMLMALNRTIELKGQATVSGEIIANRFELRGSTGVLHPALVSQCHAPKDNIENSDLSFRYCMCDARMLTALLR